MHTSVKLLINKPNNDENREKSVDALFFLHKNTE